MALIRPSWGQKSSAWQFYNLADGLPESACVSVTAVQQGKVVVRHLRQPFISELDGYGINPVPAPENSVGRVYESPGGQLWTVVPGGLQEYKNDAWVFHPVPEIAQRPPPSRFATRSSLPLYPTRQGRVLFLLPESLMEFNAENPDRPVTEILRTANQTALRKFSGMTLGRDGGLWICGPGGFAKVAGPLRSIKPDSEWKEYRLPDSLQVKDLSEPREDETGSVTAIGESSTDGKFSVVLFDGQHWSAQSAGNEKIQLAWRGPGKILWAATADKLLQWLPGRLDPIENEEISARAYSDVAVEPNGAFWLATSDKLFRYAPQSWRSPASVAKLNSVVHCTAADREGRLWFIAGNSLCAVEKDLVSEYPFPTPNARQLQAARAIFPLKNGNILIEARNELFQFEPGRKAFVAPPDRASRRQVLGSLKDGRLCVERLLSDNSFASTSHLETFDGSRFEPLPDPPTDPLVASNLLAFFTAQNGDLWLGGERATALYHEKKWRVFSSTDKSTPESVISFAEIADGKIWCATSDKVWEFDGRNWSTIGRGFDRVNGLIRTRDGSAWVASNNGLLRYSQGNWIENGTEEGLSSPSVRGLCEDQSGRFWAATTHGLSMYFPDADVDPPQTFIQPILEREKSIPEGGTITIAFGGRDKWKFTPRNRLLYSYRLDEHEWSSFQEVNGISFTDLPAGKHYFLVRAMDRNCNIDPKPARLEFSVVLPWYRETRLVLISFGGLGCALFFAGLSYNRHRRLLHSYAEVEQKVAQRTRELEIANRELLHSQKMNALGTLAAGIAHDFNNILSIVKGSAQIIEDNLENPEKVRTRIDRIKTVVEQGAGIVKAMLGFSRDSADQIAACDLNEAVKDTVKLLGDRFLREVQVTFEPGIDVPDVMCSKDFIQQILLNFIFNAAESMAKRKQVILSTKTLEKLPPGMILAPAKTSVYAAISVKDFGSGIPPENMSRIFEPFFTTKAMSARRGTGLGLSMVYELAKKLDAGIAVESIVNNGSVFTLILPVQSVTTANAAVEAKVETVP
jgi:signal transduction histidine kinase/ligand-binding sensor domain-containing protein